MMNHVLNPFEPVKENAIVDVLALRDGDPEEGSNITVDEQGRYRTQIFLSNNHRCDLILPKNRKFQSPLFKRHPKQFEYDFLWIKNCRVISDRELELVELPEPQLFLMIEDFQWSLPGIFE